MTQAEVIAKMQIVFDDVFMDKVELTPALTAKDVPEWESLIHITWCWPWRKALAAAASERKAW